MNKRKWIVTTFILIVVVLIAVGICLGGSSLLQKLQAHIGGL